MGGKRGYIKLWRVLFEHPFFTRGKRVLWKRVDAWVDILSSVAWEEHTLSFHGVTARLRPGQMLFTYRTLASRWQIPKSSAERLVAGLRRNGMVRVQRLRRKAGHQLGHQGWTSVSLLTVCNWRRWQGTGVSPLAPNRDTNRDTDIRRKKRSPSSQLADPDTRSHQPLAADEEDAEMHDIPEVVTQERDIIKAAAACVSDFQRTLPSGFRAKLAPPSKRDFDRLMQLIVANGGRWAEVSAGLVGITREAVERKKDIGSIAYPIQVWLARAPEREVAKAVAEAAAAGPDERVERLVSVMAKRMQISPERTEPKQEPVAPAPKPETPEERRKREAWQAQYRAEREADEKAELTDAERKRISEMARETIERLTH